MRQRKIKKITNIEPVEPMTEKKKINKNRNYRFRELLGEDIEELELERIVNSDIDYWDLDKLIKNGCEPNLAIEILS